MEKIIKSQQSSLLLELKLVSNNNDLIRTCVTTPSSPTITTTSYINSKDDNLSVSSTSSFALSSSSSSNCSSSSSPSSQSPPDSLCFKLKEEETEENDNLSSQISTKKLLFYNSFTRNNSAKTRRNKSQSFTNLTNKILTKKFSFSSKQHLQKQQQEQQQQTQVDLIQTKSKSMNKLLDLPLTSSIKMINWFKDLRKAKTTIEQTADNSTDSINSPSSEALPSNEPDTSSTSSSVEIMNSNDDFETKNETISKQNMSNITTSEDTAIKHNLPPTKPFNMKETHSSLFLTKDVGKPWSRSSSSSNSSSASSSPSSISYLLPNYSFSSPKSNKSSLNFSRNLVRNNTIATTPCRTSSTHLRPRFDPRSVQKIVLEWCQFQTKDYKNVNITNFSSSWSDGLAFCALIHSFLPQSFDYTKLDGRNRFENFELAFEVALKEANIAPLLEVDDMIKMGNRPDDRCVYTYVSTIYSRFKSMQRSALETAQ